MRIRWRMGNFRSDTKQPDRESQSVLNFFDLICLLPPVQSLLKHSVDRSSHDGLNPNRDEAPA